MACPYDNELLDCIATQFARSLSAIDKAQWFGRILLYQYAIEIDGTAYNETQIRGEIAKEEITASDLTGNVTYTKDRVTGEFKANGTIRLTTTNGTVKEQRYDFEHVIEPAWRIKSTKLTKS